MPRVNINEHYYRTETLGAWIVGQLFRKNLKKTALADALDITRQGLDWKLRHNCFDYGEMLTVFKFLQSTDAEILGLMKIY